MRPLVLGNGKMLAGFDERLVLRDLYFPRVGQVNQIAGRTNRIGIWADGAFTWVGEPGWELRLDYLDGTLVTDAVAVHPGLELAITFHDGVHPREPILIRHLRLRDVRLRDRQHPPGSLAERPRQLRVYAAHDFDLDETDIGDTALWDPTLGAVIHYKRSRWFLMGGQGPGGGIAQFATGRKRFHGAEGTWRDAEDGQLEGHPISQGSVDSVIGLELQLEQAAEADLYFWLVCATDYDGARRGDRLVCSVGPGRLLEEAVDHWRSWVEEGRRRAALLPPDLQEALVRGMLIIQAHMDQGGAILAASDSDILQYNRDHYGYVWPRDGAFIAAALDRAGYGQTARRFYDFCRRTRAAEGFFWHKYNPDGTIGSSWHPWIGPKGVQLPIQEDETGLVLWALGEHLRLYPDPEYGAAVYGELIRPAADFLTRYRDGRTGLPEESYDLWEERRGIFTFTVSAVVAGLRAAAEAARGAGDQDRARRYGEAAEGYRQAALHWLWSADYRSFLRGVYLRTDGEVVADPTPDSSILGIFLLGLLPADDPRVEATVERLERELFVPIGGMARYRTDYYFRAVDDPAVPGNPWIICTLWLARYLLARARSRADLERPEQLIRWALNSALPGGGLPEQLHPVTGVPLSVAPLVWSHATMIDALLDLAEAMKRL